ncbi:alpha/beta fold hydrolase [Flavobacterium branchiicola]|uniref:Alpha/beta fold hydrolase n=1 Tax=Flavobacterium branchiicola TaxID=1114875 RepID=A0ABV9PHS5_9FLAO|nr:alpha/beta fold hydrolase [Flavobacterium branchiicola]MBS7256351.1 alpha/beta fold hydrolase [Flavobacterium branchiicola]
MKLKTTFIAIAFLLVTFLGKINAQNVTFEKSAAFLSQFQKSDSNQMVWGYLNVPETWGSKDGKTIKIAVTVLKNTSNIKNPDAVVFLQGGPGASGIDNIWSWLDHPLRKNNDIVLFDVRGTGYSQPRLSTDLGKKFLEILAKNQTEQEDEKQKTDVAIACKQDLINRKINIDSYNSLAVAEDLHALKSALNYKNWNVYGVSYGTYIAQVYANTYPEDVKSLLLDSAIYDISTYYVENTSNYMNSLKKVFEICKKEKEEQYPNLEQVYYEVIADLEQHPLTVNVDKSIVSTGKFTYNAEDFKIAIQQALYNKQLVEIIPLLVYQFHKRNGESLGNLVSAFSSLLGMDYGVYYCITCNETIPNNDYAKYEQNASNFKGLNGGVSFYKSDFKVCNAWNSNRTENIKKSYDLSNLSKAAYPILVFSGEFDPITPLSNGKKVAARFKNATYIEAKTYGHVPAFTRIGREVAENFIDNSNQKPDQKAFDKATKLSLVSGVIINQGVSKTGKSISDLDPVFLIPLLIALVLMLVFVFMYVIKLIQNKYTTTQDKIIRIFITITSVLGLVLLGCLVLAIIEVSKQNFFVLAFGLPDSFNYIFSLVLVFIGFLILSVVYYISTLQKTNDRSVTFTVIFSNILLATYLFYWGII